MPAFDLNSDDEASGSQSGAVAPSVSSSGTTLAAELQVNVARPDKAAFYASLFLPVDFGLRQGNERICQVMSGL